MRKAASTIVNGANSIFFGDTTILIKRSWIDDDSEAIRKDWEAVGMDWKIVIEKYDKEHGNVAEEKQTSKETAA